MELYKWVMWIFDPKKLAAIASLLHARRHHTYTERMKMLLDLLKTLL